MMHLELEQKENMIASVTQGLEEMKLLLADHPLLQANTKGVRERLLPLLRFIVQDGRRLEAECEARCPVDEEAWQRMIDYLAGLTVGW